MMNFSKAVFLVPVIAMGVSSAALADETKRAQAQANFIEADSNSDKALNADEFRTFVDLNAEDKIGRMPKIKRMGMQDRAFNRVDANSDGYVTADEMAVVAGKSANQQ